MTPQVACVRVRAIVLLLALLACAPLASADVRTGSAYGVNGGYADAGLWDAYTWNHWGGDGALGLTWDLGLFPCGADYDLWLYPPGALDDGVLDEQPLAISESHACGHAREDIARSLPAGSYVVVVIPWQAEGEHYRLESSTGSLQYTALTVGTEFTCPTPSCFPLG